MTSNDLETIGKRGFYRPSARVSFEQAVEMVAGAMREARALDLTDLLVNTKGLLGFSQPSIFARYTLAVEWARSSGAALRVALVARPEIIDAQKIGVLMAQNRGVSGDVFTNEPDAIAWLDSYRADATGVGTAQTDPKRP